MSVQRWIIEAVDVRYRCRLLALELLMLLGRDRGRIVVWCCRFYAFVPGSGGYWV